MPEFKYITKDKSGRTVSGRKIAASRQNLILELGRRDLTVVSIEEIGRSAKKRGEGILSKSMFGGRKVKTFDLLIFCRQLATMLHGGVAILNAIESISTEMKNKKFKSVLEDITKDLRSGKTLSESLKKYTDTFSNLFIAMVEAGEKVGSLDTMLTRLSSYLEFRDRLAKKVRSATTYPAFIAIFFLVAIAVITRILIPRFKNIYDSFGAELPPLTKYIFEISNFFIQNTIWILVGLVIAIFTIFFFVRYTRKGRVVFDKSMLGLPIFGAVIKKAAISKFCRTLSTLLDQGIAITEALLLVGRTSGNILIEDASTQASKLVMEGEVIPAALSKMEIFPPLMLQMASVGAEAGSLPELLGKTADFYEEQVDIFVSTLTSMIEPILVVCLGGIIGVMVIAMYLPILQLGSVLR